MAGPPLLGPDCTVHPGISIQATIFPRTATSSRAHRAADTITIITNSTIFTRTTDFSSNSCIRPPTSRQVRHITTTATIGRLSRRPAPRRQAATASSTTCRPTRRCLTFGLHRGPAATRVDSRPKPRGTAARAPPAVAAAAQEAASDRCGTASWRPKKPMSVR